MSGPRRRFRSPEMPCSAVCHSVSQVWMPYAPTTLRDRESKSVRSRRRDTPRPCDRRHELPDPGVVMADSSWRSGEYVGEDDVDGECCAPPGRNDHKAAIGTLGAACGVLSENP